MDSIELAIFSSRLNAICDEMGFALQRSALSPNIKDRLDFSCAIFDVDGGICAQAAHIPVHLGSMAFAMKGIVSRFEWHPGDMLVMNDPFLGGTHLPDVTLVAPVFVNETLTGFVANRAHHANIGSETPGSMPLSDCIEQEGVIIAPVKLIEAGNYVESVILQLAQVEGQPIGVSKPELSGDFFAQLSANKIGVERLSEWVEDLPGQEHEFFAGLDAINEYGRKLASELFDSLPQGSALFSDVMDDDGFGNNNIKINLSVRIQGGQLSFDFSGTDQQVKGNINCPFSVCAASIYYVFVCLLPEYAPCCKGVFESISISAPEGTIVNAMPGAAVAAGNVETSMRIVDVAIGALAALGIELPSASQGTMNNVAMGANTPENRWDYYETIGGGEGASSQSKGRSAIHSHMTNTLNTPVESLEMHYPLRIERYEVRSGSGGNGKFDGGDGIVRAYRFLAPASVTLLTERRRSGPWGISGGKPGLAGKNTLNKCALPAKVAINVEDGDLLEIETPGGGGWGARG